MKKHIPPPNHKKEFGTFLKQLLTKHHLKQKDIAEMAGCGKAFISQICSGLSPTPPELFNQTYSCLKECGASAEDLNEYVKLYTATKTNIELQSDITQSDPLKKIIIENLDRLNDDSLAKLIRYQEELVKTQ